MKLIPSPKKSEIKEGFLTSKTLNIAEAPTDERIQKALEWFSCDADGTRLELSIGACDDESYTIEIDEKTIRLNSNGPAGAFYAIQTLRQIFANEQVPCCSIEDAPDFRCRGFYHDITRGKVPKVETIKKLIDEMAYYKLNSLQLYVEHTFEFTEFADSIHRTGYLSAAELREIDTYCHEHFIEFIPSLATFGHLYELLEQEQYRHLQEIENFESSPFFWENRMRHHTIDPTQEESFELIKRLIDQYLVCFSSDKFNICGDETFDLKDGKHKSEDTGKLYLDFIRKIVEYLQSKGKKVLMWADILLNHPEQIDKLPTGVSLLNWYYWTEPDEKTFEAIQNANRPQIVCPGTGSWMGFCELVKTEIENICKMTELGYQYGAEGVLNTNWGDWGNPCSLELAMFGLVLGAAKSWNVSTTVDKPYLDSVNDLLYKHKNAVSYLMQVSDCSEKIRWELFAKCYANMITDGSAYVVEYPSAEALRLTITECQSVMDAVAGEVWEESRFQTQLLLSAEAVAIMAEHLAVLAGYTKTKELDTQAWLAKYRKSWLDANKESELTEIEKAFLAINTQTTSLCNE
ncbi:MAG: family 20 glycosylhydrolase [Oscillospiraceae bacterium]|nr:family 20 glycosylhydrolase [Oscillospiraceae bacterium]